MDYGGGGGGGWGAKGTLAPLSNNWGGAAPPPPCSYTYGQVTSKKYSTVLRLLTTRANNILTD